MSEPDRPEATRLPTHMAAPVPPPPVTLTARRKRERRQRELAAALEWARSTVEPRTAPAADRPCQLHQYHSPVVVRTQLHHSKPVYLQNRVYGRIVYPGDLWLCGTDHDSLHETIDWLLGEGRKPSPMPGRKTLAEAQRTVQWYRDAMGETA